MKKATHLEKDVPCEEVPVLRRRDSGRGHRLQALQEGPLKADDRNPMPRRA
jgi:hypothetical protein